MDIPNGHRLWPGLLQLRQPDRKPPACKHPTTPSTQPRGFNMWHIVCLGILPMGKIEDFLEGSFREPSGRVFDELFEHITAPLPIWWLNYQVRLGRVPDNRIGQDLVGLGVESLCRLQGLSLFGHYLHEGVLNRPINPAALAFETWISNEVLTAKA